MRLSSTNIAAVYPCLRLSKPCFEAAQTSIRWNQVPEKLAAVSRDHETPAANDRNSLFDRLILPSNLNRWGQPSSLTRTPNLTGAPSARSNSRHGHQRNRIRPRQPPQRHQEIPRRFWRKGKGCGRRRLLRSPAQPSQKSTGNSKSKKRNSSSTPIKKGSRSMSKPRNRNSRCTLETRRPRS